MSLDAGYLYLFLPVCEQDPCCHSDSRAFLKRHNECQSKSHNITMCSVTVAMNNDTMVTKNNVGESRSSHIHILEEWNSRKWKVYSENCI